MKERINIYEMAKKIFKKNNIPLISLFASLFFAGILVFTKFLSYIMIRAQFDYYNINTNLIGGITSNLLLEFCLTVVLLIYIVVVSYQIAVFFDTIEYFCSDNIPLNLGFIRIQNNKIKRVVGLILIIVFYYLCNLVIPLIGNRFITAIFLVIMEVIISEKFRDKKKENAIQGSIFNVDYKNFKFTDVFVHIFFIILFLLIFYFLHRMSFSVKKDYYIIENEYVIVYIDSEKIIASKFEIENNVLNIDTGTQIVLENKNILLEKKVYNSVKVREK